MSNTFAIPWTVAHHTPLSMGFPRQEYGDGLPFFFPKESSQPQDQTHTFCTGRWILYHRVTRDVHKHWSVQFSSVQLPSLVWLFANPWIAARQDSLSITNTQSSLRLTSIESVMPSSHLILCRPLLLLPSIFPSIRVFSNESVLCITWPKYWSFSFSIDPSNDHPGLISFRMDWLNLLAVQGTLKSTPTRQFKSINSSALRFLHSPTLTSIHDHRKNHSLD